MMTANAILALVLIAGPADVDPALADVLRPELLAVGIAAELVDVREAGWIQLAAIRSRWHDLADAPGLDEAERFPDVAFVRRALECNRARRLRLTERLAVDLIFAADLRAEIACLDRLYETWDALRDSRCDYYYWPSVRRIALRRLRELIGEENFAMGRMPPAVP